ncbi:L-threonylcarbamoyladenylate synthase [Raineyella sp. LH-20]|uniref:L-threonylcarbamoyladenylate synthase n=1 Tax=Raineyella sp. LH-20 TaxID=3081204 RepID=UPI002955043D|nr:L-threonylcarbamoyladenylate synthase [Raineyella sp. LH-20]WOP20260.1 L-threonylcarbamoyladenylate synthase [Raineyella sp. LH-20]
MSDDSKDIASGAVPPAPQPRIVDCRVGDPGQALTAAKEVIADGRVMVMPTDTVYGICADAFDAYAVQRLLTAKRRGREMPPPVLISDEGVMTALATDVPPAVRTLVARFWPGPLTVICTAQASLKMDLGETKGTIALRVPDNDLARQVLRRTGPLAVSSANVSGRPPATTVEEAAEQLGLDVALYLDGGPTPGPVPSTIVDFTAYPEGRVVREGIITLDQLREVSPGVRALDGAEAEEPEATAPEEAEATAESAPTGAAEVTEKADAAERAEAAEKAEAAEASDPEPSETTTSVADEQTTDEQTARSATETTAPSDADAAPAEDHRTA